MCRGPNRVPPPRPSSSAKADDPVFRNASDGIEKPRRTGYPAGACHRARQRRDPVAGYDDLSWRLALSSARNDGERGGSNPGFVIPGWSEGPDPESRDSGFDASHRPGMTATPSPPPHLIPNRVSPNSAFCVEGCERQYCGGASTWPPSSAAACQPQRGS